MTALAGLVNTSLTRNINVSASLALGAMIDDLKHMHINDLTESQPENAHAEARPLAFLSSIYQAAEVSDEAASIRARIWECGRRLDAPIWVAEHSSPTLGTQPPLAIVDECLRQVAQAEIFVCVLHGRHGSRITALAEQARWHASHFEMEIYQAAVLGKPIRIFQTLDFEPEPQLADLLELLADILPTSPWPRLSDEQIVGEIERLISGRRLARLKARLLPRRPMIGPALVDGLAWRRDHAAATQTGMPSVQFLDGRSDRSVALPDYELVELALDEADREHKQQRRLARYWIALRELMGAHYGTTRAPRTLLLWDRALDRWGGAAAWYGLHGHLYMGCLAAFGSLCRIRTILADAGHRDIDPMGLQQPHGPLASAYYSLAKRHRDRSLRRAALKAAMHHIGQAISSGDNDRSGCFAIKASIELAQGNTDTAISDYRNVLSLRRDAGEGPGRIGEAQSELGFAQFRAWDVKEGFRNLEDGVDLLGRGSPSGFLVRAKRKLGLAYLAKGAVHCGLNELAAAYRIAVDLEMHDQITPAMRWAVRIGPRT